MTFDSKLPTECEERQNQFEVLVKENSDDENVEHEENSDNTSYCDITTGNIIHEKRNRKQARQYHADIVTKIPNIPVPTLDAPRSYKEALKSPHAEECKKAADKEITGLLDNVTWDLVDLPPGKKSIGLTMIYDVKLNPD